MYLIPKPENDPFNEQSVKPVHWHNTDPRDPINKRADFDIVILRPALSGRGWEAGMGQVATEHVYCVFTSFENHSLVGKDDDWDDLWMWMRAPERNI